MVSFEDVAVTFTREEGQHLSDAQRSLYRTVMLETYCHLLSVGQRMTKPELIIKLEQGAEPWTGQEPPTQRRSGQYGQNERKRAQHWISPGIESQCSEWGNPLFEKSTQWNSDSSCEDDSQPCDQHGNSFSNQLPLLQLQMTHRPRKTLQWQAYSESFNNLSACTVTSPDVFQETCQTLAHKSQWEAYIRWRSCNYQEFGKTLTQRTDLPVHETSEEGEKAHEHKDYNKINHKKSYLSDMLNTHLRVKPYKCQECKKTFKWESSLLLHMTGHTGAKDYKCLKLFHQKSNLGLPLKSHPGDKPFECPQSLQSSPQRQLQTKKLERPYECHECHKSFGRKSNLTAHLRVHTGEKPFRCNACPKTFGQKGNFIAHLRTHTGVKPYQCMECKKSFSQTSSLKKHLNVHTGEKPYECKECHKMFSQKANLKKHLNTHTRERTYECNDCNQTFDDKKYLNEHLKSHTVEQTNECKECHKIFKCGVNLRMHLKTHTGERPYECKECQKTFKWKISLNRHMLIHTGERPYECKECHRTFMQKSSLLSHLQSHTEERPYECKECHKTFKWKINLNRHVKTHTGESPYECKECHKTFKWKISLGRHVKAHRRDTQ